MKKFLILGLIASTSLFMVHCGSAKKAQASAKATYSKDVLAVIESKCTPCHIPSKGGKKTAYDVYANVKADIDNIIRRIELNPGERGFMPMRGEKLNAETIALFKKWKEDGMAE